MKIAQVTPYFLPVEGGLERHVYYISKELIKRGHEVDVLTSDIDRYGNRLPHHEVIDGINVYRFRTWFKLGDFGAFWPGFVRKLKEYDIVHVHNYRHPHTVLAAIYCKLKGIPCVITTHSPFHANRRLISRLLVNLYDFVVSRLVDPLFDAIITVNLEEFTLFSRKFPGKVYFIPSSGIKEEYIKREKTLDVVQEEKTILMIGRIHPSKGTLEATEILRGLLRHTKNVKLKIMGPVEDNKYFNTVKEYIKGAKISQNVEFLGPIYEEDKKFNIIDRATVLLVPSKYEAAGLVIIEALARGVPVVARKSPGPQSIRELCGCESCIVLYEETEDAVKDIMYLMEKPPSPQDCIECAKVFTWKRIAEEIVRVYKSVETSARSGGMAT